MAVDRLIGVDFGTSTSVIRVKRYENGEPIGEKLETKEVVFGGNGAMVPTLIMKKDDDASVCYFGYEAQQRKKKFTNFHSFKMDLESADPEKRAQAKRLTEEFYDYIAKQYQSQSDGGHLGSPEDREQTIISYPVKWTEETKAFMLETAKKAGFPNVTGMDEAQAAIQAVMVMSADHLRKHGLLQSGEAANILLIDMGAGTTDLVLARYVPGENAKTEVLNTWPKSGDIQFGGREIDNLLQNFFRELLDEEEADLVFRRIGADKFKSWKEETVSPALRNQDSVSDFEVLDSCVEMMDIELGDYCLDRAALENCLADYLRQFPALVNGCLGDAGVSGRDVDLVIVTGGHSQWYFVGDMLAGKMPRFGTVDLPRIRENPGRIIPISRPQETVALGLAYSGLRGAEEPEQVELPMVEKTAEPVFAMKIAHLFSASGGTGVGGTVALGEVTTGEYVYAYDPAGNEIPGVRVKSIAVSGKQNLFSDDFTAVQGDQTVLLLDNPMGFRFSEGMILFRKTNEWDQVSPEALTRAIQTAPQAAPAPVVPSEPDPGDFRMKIDSYQVFATGQGTVVWGVIEAGKIWAEEQVFVCGRANGQVLTDQVIKINVGNTMAPSAQKGERVGLLLPKLKKEEVVSGTYLCGKPDFSASAPAPAESTWDKITSTVRTATDTVWQAAQQSVEQRRAQELEAAQRRTAAPVDPKTVPYTPENEFELNSVGECYAIRKYLGSRAVVSIPPFIRGRRVVMIGPCAFGGPTIVQGNKAIETVIIPETVCNIGMRAFTGCFNLHTVIAHPQVVEIGESAFWGCDKLQTLDFGMGTGLPGHVTFPPFLRKIGPAAFNKAVSLTGATYLKEVMLSKNTAVQNMLGCKTFDPKICAVFYYD
ncbi:MAG: Hsp70 family protein [Oscillospiraceae bacterium]|nr:Hsp70 family protein [Oscillospiraceae bacterium]